MFGVRKKGGGGGLFGLGVFSNKKSIKVI